LKIINDKLDDLCIIIIIIILFNNQHHQIKSKCNFLILQICKKKKNPKFSNFSKIIGNQFSLVVVVELLLNAVVLPFISNTRMSRPQIIMAKILNHLGINVAGNLADPGMNGTSWLGKTLVTLMFKGNDPPNIKLVELAGILPSEKPIIVEIGFGTGTQLNEILKRYPNHQQIIGYERSKDMITDAMANYGTIKNAIAKQTMKLEFRDVSKFGLPSELSNSVDAVFHSNVIYFVDSPLGFTQEIYRVLKPGGKLCMNVIRKDVMPKDLLEQPNSPFKNFYDEQSITELCVQVGFKPRSIVVHPFPSREEWRQMLIIAAKN
jgi:SAM-dependent methyltransferase